MNFKHVVHANWKRRPAADYSPSILLLDSTPQLIANWLLIVQSCRPRGLRVGGRCSMWNHRKELCRDKVWMGELTYRVMDGCMLLNKSSTLSVKTAKTSSSIHWCQNFDLNCRKTEKSSQNETSKRRLQELNLLYCWQLSTLYTCNNFSTVSGASGWSTGAGQLHLARAVRAAFAEHVMPFSIRAHWGVNCVLKSRWPSWAVLTSLTVSMDVKHWSQFVPNMLCQPTTATFLRFSQTRTLWVGPLTAQVSMLL